MEIIKEIVLPVFNFKIQLYEEYNEYDMITEKYFYILLNDKKIKHKYKGNFKYMSIDFTDLLFKTILNDNILPILEKILIDEYSKKIEIELYHHKENDKYFLTIGKAKFYFDLNEINTNSSYEEIEKFTCSIRKGIKIFIEQWKKLNIPVSVILKKEF